MPPPLLTACLALCLSFCAAASTSPPCDFHASLDSGGSTLLDARDAVRARLASTNGVLLNDLVVCVSGVHTVGRGAPFSLGPADAVAAGPGRVVWRGVGAGGALSGGLQLTGWRAVTLGGGSAFVTSLPEGAYPLDLVVRQLWVNGSRASRTSFPPSALGSWTRWVSPDNSSVGYTVSGAIPPAWLSNSTASIEFTYAIAIANWIQPRCTVASIDAATRNITLAAPCGSDADQREAHNGVHLPTPVGIEAAPAFPLPPGTLYHDVAGGLLYYALAPGQSAALLESDAWVPVADVLLQVANASGHAFENVTFAHGGWWQPNTPRGYVDAQTAVYAGGEPPGAVRVSGSSAISFTGCAFEAMGAPYALEVANSSADCAVARCTFKDLSGGAVKLGNVADGSGAFSPDPADWDARLSVADCTVADGSVEYEGAAAIFAGFVQSAEIAHNLISDVSYSAVSVGWGWGSVSPPGFGNNTVAGNRIERCMTRLRDGGGVYCNGAEDGTGEAEGWQSLITGNYVDQDLAVFAVYYLDNGASNWRISYNVAGRSPLAWAFYMQGYGTVARNDSVDHFWYDFDNVNGTGPAVNHCVATGCTVDNATVYRVNGTWPAEAQEIIDAAGPRAVEVAAGGSSI